MRFFLATMTLLWGTSVAWGDQAAGLDAKAFDRSVRVQDDLYMAVNGQWLTNTPIPHDKSNYGSFTILQDLSQQRLKQIIEAAAEGEHPTGSDAQMVGDMYRSFMDVDRVNQLGIAPLGDELAKIDAIDSKAALLDYMGTAQALGLNTPIRVGVSLVAQTPVPLRRARFTSASGASIAMP